MNAYCLTRPLLKRKEILKELVRENERIAVSRYIKEQGKQLFELTVSSGVRREMIKTLKKGPCPFRNSTKNNDNIVWCKPEKVCTVEYMPNTLDALRQPVFKGIRDDA